MSMLSVGLNNWLIKNGINEGFKVCLCIPVNLRPLPNNINELKLGNYIHVLKFELPIHNNIESGIKSAKTVVKSYLSPSFLFAVSKFMIVVKYLPLKVLECLFFDFYKNIQLIFSNVPFAEKPSYFCNREIFDF
mmetsp:Transcript_26311/g.30432  ORF Transcript_26311/g.30432 Transcript_26311/m.30432 type:complete len:134 (+) Transcript_26311:353-754(+)